MKLTFRQFLEDITVSDDIYSHSDADYTVRDAQRSVSLSMSWPKSQQWKKLPAKFPVEGFEIIYKGDTRRAAEVVLLDTREIPKIDFFNPTEGESKRVAIHLRLDARGVPLRNDTGRAGDLYGMKTDVLSGASKYRGTGLAPMLYQNLIEHGQVLFSSNEQSPGGQFTWRRLIKNVSQLQGVDVGVILRNSIDAGVILSKNLKHNPHMKEPVARQLALSQGVNVKKPSASALVDACENALVSTYPNSSYFLVTGPIEALDKIAYDKIERGSFWVIAPNGYLAPYQKYAIKVE